MEAVKVQIGQARQQVREAVLAVVAASNGLMMAERSEAPLALQRLEAATLQLTLAEMILQQAEKLGEDICKALYLAPPAVISNDEADARERVRAAAPALLAACRLLVKGLRKGLDGISGAMALEVAEKAIADAAGE